MATCSNDVPELLVDYESPIWEDFENIEIDSMFDLPVSKVYFFKHKN